MATTASDNNVQKLYIAYFGRAADPAGLAFYSDALANGTTTIEAIATSFATSAEAQPIIALSTGAFLTAMYQQAFARAYDPSPAVDGTFWADAIDSGATTQSLAMVQILQGAQAGGQDASAVANKVAVATTFTAAVATNGTVYAGTSAAAAAKAVLTPVTFDAATVTTGNTAAASVAASFPTDTSTAQTFTLSTGADTIPGLTGSNGSSSTDGNNIISAIVEHQGGVGGTTSSTLNSSDSLNAGSGADTLSVRIVSLGGLFSVTPVLNSVETVSVFNANKTTFQSANIDLSLATGTTTVEFKDSSDTADTAFSNVLSTTVISLDNADSTTRQAVNFSDAANRSGTADAFAITIANGSGTSDSPAVINLETPNGFDDTSFETANITVAGASSFILSGDAWAALTTVNVTGETTGVTTGYGLTLDQGLGFTNLKTVNASGMTGGGLAINAAGSSATGFTFTGSSANDLLILDKTTLNNAGTLDGGAGTNDILATSSFSVSPSVVNSSTGFEVLAAISPTSSLAADSFTSINSFMFAGGQASGRVNITGVESNDRFIFTSNQGNSDEAVRFTGLNIGNAVVFEMKASSGTNGEVTIIANDNTGNDVSAIGFQGGISAVTIDSTGQNSNANLIQAVDTGSYHYQAFYNTGGLGNFTITGSQDLTIAAKEGVNLSSSSDTLGFSNAANVNAANFTGSLRIAGSNSGDVITGGSGDDIIYGLSGADTLTGNAGSDQFRMVGTNGTDNIKDFVNGTDKIGFNNVAFANTNATSAGATLASTDYVDNRSGITSIGTSDDNKVVELQSSLSSSQIQSDLGANVDAYVLVFDSTTNKAELWHDANWSDANNRSHVATFDDVVTLVGVQAFSNTDFIEFIA
ncbi:hypothetical protein A9Q89_01470 [Gammaproteobacteria bacterium 53_120_T64]|nr:hypothetical protein A9Q89_01470 [Gammaproteobacteria bacterium 53_120_T64]